MSINIKNFTPSNIDMSTYNKISLLSVVQKNLRIFERAPCLVGNLIQELIKFLNEIDEEKKQGVIGSGTVEYITSYVEKSINCLSSDSVSDTEKLIGKINEEIKGLLFRLKINGFVDDSELLRNKDVIEIGMKPLDYLKRVSEGEIKIDCHRFAKFYLGDYVAKVEAFFGDGKFRRYQEVTEAKRGDCIFFYKNENGVDELTHTGVMLDNSTVISKWGVNGCIVKHKIEQTPPVYGNRYLLARPFCYKGFEKKIRERIHDLREKFMDSPYTSKGLARALLDGIVPENEVDEKIVQSLREATPKEDRFVFLYEMALILSKGFINRSLA